MFDVTWDYGQSETVGQRRSRKKGLDVPNNSNNSGSMYSAPSRVETANAKRPPSSKQTKKGQTAPMTSSTRSFTSFFKGWKDGKDRLTSFHSPQNRDSPLLSKSSMMEPAELPGQMAAQTPVKPSKTEVMASIVCDKGTLSVVGLSSQVSVICLSIGGIKAADGSPNL
jgi:hypothetical protein